MDGRGGSVEAGGDGTVKKIGQVREEEVVDDLERKQKNLVAHSEFDQESMKLL